MKSLLLLTCFVLISTSIFSQYECTAYGFPESRTVHSCSQTIIENKDYVPILPTVDIDVVFHFESLPDGTNFQDSLPGEHIWTAFNGYDYASLILQEMNLIGSQFIDYDYNWPNTLQRSELLDANFRFHFANGNLTNSVFFYDNGTNYNALDHAMNIEITGDTASTSIAGGTYSGVNYVTIKNTLHRMMTNPIPHEFQANSQNIIHEIFHTMDLDHTYNKNNLCNGIAFNCSDEVCGLACTNTNGGAPPNPDQIDLNLCGNLIMSYGDSQRRLTLCELGLLWDDLLKYERPYRNYSCNPDINRTITIEDGGDLTWDRRRILDADLVISNNTHLTLECDLLMGTDRKIIVEKGSTLSVIGGKVGSLCGDEWQGIIVEGDGASGTQANAGKVLLEDAIIEKARHAISMNPSHLGWPAAGDHWGGLVQAENSTFIDCHRAVEFMKYGTEFIEDDSYFTNCTFQNIESSAVTMWSNNGVEFTGCNFENVLERGIVAHDSKIIVSDGCNFSNTHTGIKLSSSYPAQYGSIIGITGSTPNTFQCHNYGIYSTAEGNAKALEVKNNNFLGTLYGVHLNGMSNYLIRSNDFSGGYASTEPVATGTTHSNYVDFNNISSASYGSHAVYDNKNLEYKDNCFGYNVFSDIYINSGDIFIDQGDEDFANGNCFTKNNVPEIDNSQNDPIKLWVWKDEPPNSCEYPTFVKNNPSYNVIVDENSLHKNQDNCGSMYTPGIINVNSFCQVPIKHKDKLLTKIAQIESTINDIENNEKLSPEYKAYLLKIYERCLKKLRLQVIIIILEPEPDDPARLSQNQRTESAITYASALPDFDLKIFAYGLMVNTNQIVRARTYINSINTARTEEVNFVTAQNILLDYLSDVVNYQLSPSSESTLFNIGMGTKPLDGYARSIYELITGDEIEMNIPDPHNTVRPRTLLDLGYEMPSFSVFPNPNSTGIISIKVDGIDDKNFNLSIYDFTGKLILSDLISDRNTDLLTDTWGNGIYLFNFSDDTGKIVKTEKVIITK